MISSREIAIACEQNVVFMALSARSVPHFTTIAQFVREMGPVIKGLFVETLRDGTQSYEDLPLRMDNSDGAERIEGDGGVEKKMSTLSTRKDGK